MSGLLCVILHAGTLTFKCLYCLRNDAMDEINHVTADEIEEWADEHNYDQQDIDNLASIVQVGQLAINTLSEEGLSYESQACADAVYEALYELSSIESGDDYVEPAGQYVPEMALRRGIQQMRSD